MKFCLILVLAIIALPTFAGSLNGQEVLIIDGISVSAQYSDEGWSTEGQLYDSRDEVRNQSFRSTKSVYMKYSVQPSISINDVIEDMMFVAVDRCRGMGESVTKDVANTRFELETSSSIPESSINMKNHDFVSMRCVIEASGHRK
jgi:hypothetical protein